MQHELEELLSVKCEIEPSSANIFLQTGFERSKLIIFNLKDFISAKKRIATVKER